MKRPVKLLAWIVVVIVVGLAASITLTIGWRPFIGPRARTLTSQKFERTPARLARGEYLINDVTDCMGCHSEHDWTAHDAPVVPGTLGSGQDMNLLKGFPGRVYAPNITPDPTGAGHWTDDQLGRAIREGVGHDGRALFSHWVCGCDRKRCHEHEAERVSCQGSGHLFDSAVWFAIAEHHCTCGYG